MAAKRPGPTGRPASVYQETLTPAKKKIKKVLCKNLTLSWVFETTSRVATGANAYETFVLR
jgi:hypothetical protein